MKRHGFVLLLCLAISSLLIPESASAKSRKAVQREQARMRALLRQFSDQQLLARIEQCENEVSELWPKFTEAYSRLSAAIAMTRAWTNFPTPAGPPVMIYDPVASGCAISPMYLSRWKVFQMSEASPVYRRVVQQIVYYGTWANMIGSRIQSLSYEMALIESEVQRRAGQNQKP